MLQLLRKHVRCRERPQTTFNEWPSSYRRLLSRFHADIKSPEGVDESSRGSLDNVPVIGFSATFGRHDGLALSTVFEEIVYHRDFLEMIKEQWYALICSVLSDL